LGHPEDFHRNSKDLNLNSKSKKRLI
jgi:hypothetical protein